MPDGTTVPRLSEQVLRSCPLFREPVAPWSNVCAAKTAAAQRGEATENHSHHPDPRNNATRTAAAQQEALEDHCRHPDPWANMEDLLKTTTFIIQTTRLTCSNTNKKWILPFWTQTVGVCLHCRSSRLWKKWKEQIINNKKPPPSWHHQLEQTPEVVMSRACPQWMFHCHATSLTSDNVWLTNSKLGEDGVGISDGCVLCRCNLTDQFWTWWR